MLNGHSSYQIGLDVDIWFTPMPDHELSSEEREFNMALNMVAKDRPAIDSKVWTYERTALVRAAAQDPVVTRVFVNPAIKKAMCHDAGADRSWLSKVRPWWGHDEHFHVRIACPPDSPQCKPQPLAGAGDGCGRELNSWHKRIMRNAAHRVVSGASHQGPPITRFGINKTQEFGTVKLWQTSLGPHLNHKPVCSRSAPFTYSSRQNETEFAIAGLSLSDASISSVCTRCAKFGTISVLMPSFF